MTISRGKIIFENGKVIPTPGYGKYVARTAFGYPYARMENLDAFRDPRK